MTIYIPRSAHTGGTDHLADVRGAHTGSDLWDNLELADAYCLDAPSRIASGYVTKSWGPFENTVVAATSAR